MFNIAPSSRPVRARQNVQNSCRRPDISKLVAARAALAARKAECKSAVDVKADNEAADAADAADATDINT
jgi:hypothetical protein